MCSLYGSRDKSVFFELSSLNSYRGTHSHSIAVLHNNGVFELIEQGYGPMQVVDLPDDCLYIGHQQAPTTESKGIQSIHPAKENGTMLWHNGIIKSHIVSQWQKLYDTGEKWDTKLLLVHMTNKGIKTGLTEADGSFACMYYDFDNLYLFRNDNSPMYVNGSSFSSTKFKNAESLESNKVFSYNNNTKEFNDSNIEFKTANSFYWSP